LGYYGLIKKRGGMGQQKDPQLVHRVETSVSVSKTGRYWIGLVKMVCVVIVCGASSFLGAWLFVTSGIVHVDSARTIIDNREKIVQQEGETISDVFKKVSPSTVAITTQSVSNNYNSYFAPQVSQGAGSGIIISKDGYILTNKHVVPDETDTVTVITAEGKEYKNVSVIGRDPSNDLAFLKIEGVTDLTPAILGDSSKVTPGQKVVAIGNALGIFRNSVTSGIVSGLGRPVQAQDASSGASEQLENLFQTDAAINPGNSGGPLVDLRGEIIGINTAISQEGQAIGFSIPINDAKGVINSVLHKGKVVKAYLGVHYISLSPSVAKDLDLSISQGALLKSSGGQPAVVTDSPADKAGLKSGDIITKVNDQFIGEGRGLASLMAQYSPGDKVDLTVLRGGKEQKIKITLEAYPL
jgi:serine protease Do